MDFNLISDREILAVPIEENGDPLVDFRDFSQIVVDNRKSSDSSSYFRLRKSAAAKLLKAQSLLPTGMKLLVVEGYRPLSLQKQYFDQYSEKLRQAHPDWDADTIYKEASKYIAPPAIIPPHTTGGAVDLTIADVNRKELDMGTRLNASPEESDNACFTAAENISAEGKANRKLLIEAMTQAGFINYPTEWWHWSYGDRYWAYVTKEPNAIFGAIE